MKTIKIMTCNMDPPRNHMHAGEFVAFKHVDGAALQCDALDSALDGIMPAARYLDIITRRLAEAAGVSEEIAAEALRDGLWNGGEVSLEVYNDGDMVMISRKGSEPLAFPLVAPADEELPTK